MKGFDVLKVKSAVKNHNKFDLSRTHLTTMDFGQIIPLFCEETVPGDKFTVSADFFARLAPLVKPTYGKFQFKTVSAFVPYHQIAVDAEAWLAGKTTMEGQTPHHRYIVMDSLDALARNSLISTTTGANATNCDYAAVDTGGTTIYRLWTPYGKYVVKILNSLGYALPQNVDLQTGSNWNTSVKSTKLSAYPILAFFKLYNDYMSQSQRFNTSGLSDLLYRIKNGLAYTGMWNNATGEITSSGVLGMFAYLNLNYENDYFTSAWQNPNNALSTVESVSSISVPVQSYGTPVYNAAQNTEVYLGVTSGSPQQAILSQRALDFLKSFDDWVRRNNYSGSRAVQQIYSRFGIKPDDFRAHYAHVISTDSMPIQIGDITSTADTGSSGAVLGDYAGKGIMSGSKSVSYSADDFGMLFIFGYFTVVPMMSFGFDRRVLRSNPLDYYNPEFDGLGADAISAGEVFASPIVAGGSDTTKDTDVFGYTERYNAYRYGRDVITGEFRDYHFNDMSVWHSGRNLTGIRALNNMVAQSSSMNTLDSTNSEYDRIFSTNTGAEDHFYLTANFKVDAIRPMLNLNQVPQLGEGDTVVPRNGNVIS